MPPLLVLVSGRPGSGKRRWRAGSPPICRFPLLSKDTIKEALGRTLEVDSVERSRQLGGASVDALYALIDVQLGLGVSVVVDHAFHQDLADAVLPHGRALDDGPRALQGPSGPPDPSGWPSARPGRAQSGAP